MTDRSPGLPRPDRRLVPAVLAAIALVVVVKVVAGGSSSSAGLVPTSCVTPAVGVAAASVPAGGTVTFEVTGPPAPRYIAWIDAATTRDSLDLPVATPRQPGQTPVLVLAASTLTGCRLTATHPLGTQLPVGPHELVVFRIDADGSSTEVASAPFTVTRR